MIYFDLSGYEIGNLSRSTCCAYTRCQEIAAFGPGKFRHFIGYGEEEGEKGSSDGVGCRDCLIPGAVVEVGQETHQIGICELPTVILDLYD